MQNLQQTFNHSKKQIASMFALLASLLIVASTLTAIIFVNWQMQTQAKQILTNSLQTVKADFQADQLSEVSVKYQAKNATGDLSSRPLANVFEIAQRSYKQSAPANEQLKSADEVSLEGEIKNKDEFFGKSPPPANIIITDEQAFEQLKNNKQVYSRVILANGDILYSSDLFDTLSVDHTQLGFHKYSVRGVCIYAQTAKVSSGQYQDASIQVASYCPFTTAQQRKLLLNMLMVAILASALSYFLGILLANRSIRPIHESATQTKIYAQNVHHELFTPISVAITTVGASLANKNYLAGLESVNQDLTAMQQSLQLLNQQAFTTSNLDMEVINLSPVLKKQLAKWLEQATANNLVVDSSGVVKEVYKTANVTSFELIIKNLLANATKYAKSHSSIVVQLNGSGLIIKNQVNEPEKIDIKQFFNRYYRGNNANNQQGKGLGLALVKELVQIQGWHIKANLKDDWVEVNVEF